MRTLGFTLVFALLPLAACSGDKDASTGDSGTSATTGDDDDDDDDTAGLDGAQLYADNCALCHGAAGEGAASAPDDMATYLQGLDQAAVESQIVNGGGSMPAITSVTAAEASAVATWVLSEWGS